MNWELGEVLGILTFVLVVGGNIRALVWGAAKLSTHLENVTKALDEFKGEMREVVNALRQTLEDHAQRIARLEGRKDD